jgi:DNA-directed RNA polymerase specialized sigma24 family protein
LQTRHRRLLAVLDAALKELPADDRLLIEMCILRGRKVTEAARFLGLPAKPLFRRRPQILARLKRTIETAGFSWKEIAELFGIGELRWE